MSEARFRAGRVAVMVTNEGERTHTASQWAAAVTAGLVSLDPQIAPERQAEAHLLLGKVRNVLVEAFDEIHPGIAPRAVFALADGATARVLDIFSGSAWGLFSQNEDVRSGFLRHITLNLADAAGMAVRLE